MPGGRPSQGKQQRYPELEELATWFHQALGEAQSAAVERLPYTLLGYFRRAMAGHCGGLRRWRFGWGRRPSTRSVGAFWTMVAEPDADAEDRASDAEDRASARKSCRSSASMMTWRRWPDPSSHTRRRRPKT